VDHWAFLDPKSIKILKKDERTSMHIFGRTWFVSVRSPRLYPCLTPIFFRAEFDATNSYKLRVDRLEQGSWVKNTAELEVDGEVPVRDRTEQRNHHRTGAVQQCGESQKMNGDRKRPKENRTVWPF
jgi:hypothetical protein